MSDLVAGPSGASRSWGADAPRMAPSIDALRKAALAPALTTAPPARATLNELQADLASEARLVAEQLQTLATAAQQLDGRPADPCPARADSPGGLTERLAADAAHLAALRAHLAGLAARIVAALG